ncbi:hypothetical protein [Methylocaldum szegediense]|uniref:Uncharacterized protein n=1 Tax=Methylocaldum szegediense TaxID=73780 RepID=A0ABN8WWX1_9GAMM|nr:hypothetical protein [Methylocaldum szegediense]CAI8730389.1 protein of unknown function [Methylocaldum szegediense]
MARYFRTHAAGLAETVALIAPDGKTLCGRLDRFEDRKAAQLLSAFAIEEQIVLEHVLIEDGSKDHEIQAAQRRLIETLGLVGRLYTLDSLRLQKKRLKLSLPPGDISWCNSRAISPNYESLCERSVARSPQLSRPIRFIWTGVIGLSSVPPDSGPCRRAL